MKKILGLLMMLISLQMYGGTASVDAQEKKPVNIELEKGHSFNKDGWQQLKYEYYSLEVPSTWVFHFGGEDKDSIHKRNIKVKNAKGEHIEYELGTLTWGTEVKSHEDFEKQIVVQIRSIRKISGDAAFLYEVGGKIPEFSWPEWMSVQTKEEGETEGSLWQSYLLKGESQGVSVTTGAYTTIRWEYKFFVEKNGMVYCLSVSMPDAVRSSSPEYNKMARRIIQSFRAK